MGDAPQTPIRQVRLAAGLTIRELERRTGINRGRLSIIERGVPPTTEEASRILAALQVEPVAPEGSTA
jgi:transcriptional regulator with XRE-family HTH domain